MRGVGNSFYMSFNHYAKLKRIIEHQKDDWVIKRINKPTKAKTFKGETKHFDHYYRIYRKDGSEIKFAKFQQPELLAKVLNVSVADLGIVE